MQLVVKNIGKSYNKRRIVRDVSLQFPTGKIVGIIGPNGAGKTTAFYIIAGLISPDYGTVLLQDKDITAMPMHVRAKLGIVYLPQENSVFRGLTVAENIMAALEVSVTDKEEREHLLEELLSQFSINHLRFSTAVSLSGGERRRLEIARSLAANPRFLLLDEPLAGVDPIAISEITNIIMALKQKGIGVIITDHNVRDALPILDYAYVLYNGQVMAQGEPHVIAQDANVRKLYLGDNFNIG